MVLICVTIFIIGRTLVVCGLKKDMTDAQLMQLFEDSRRLATSKGTWLFPPMLVCDDHSYAIELKRNVRLCLCVRPFSHPLSSFSSFLVCFRRGKLQPNQGRDHLES